MLLEKIKGIPLGYSSALFLGKKYALTRTDFNEGRSTKVYAEELGGKDFISFNFYISKKGEKLKPCEMPAEKVIDFLYNYHLLQSE
ncbi:peptide methionine sulfoxide reductase [Arenibacter echinorum]|uniref:Peptide-methionine (S)-S-oxide reductase n=1 Tax=Arenibacter echinorum TaxID=440515 RepID=A0A327QV00_9FLAO|nr:peptide methionine sulfoxide reductase [Arenibacter echinorum]RAJ08121.1 peptide-methionine (S)-S-oxide reductase [Arenibacter echinorum]